MSERRQPKQQINCQICGALFTPKTKQNVLCGKQEYLKKASNRRTNLWRKNQSIMNQEVLGDGFDVERPETYFESEAERRERLNRPLLKNRP